MIAKIVHYAFYLKINKEAQSPGEDQIQNRYENKYKLAIEWKYKVGLYSIDESIKKKNL